MTRFIRVTAVSALVLTVAVAGCARRPAVTAMSAPAPASQGAEQPPTEALPTVQETIGEQAMVAVATERPAPADFSETSELTNVYFDFDRYAIRPGDAKTLEADAAWLKSHDVLVLIAGQCDERGTGAYNLALGDRRANAARNYLVAQGIAANRITTLSLGKERPVCTEHSEACWAQNRRGHFLVKPHE